MFSFPLLKNLNLAYLEEIPLVLLHVIIFIHVVFDLQKKKTVPIFLRNIHLYFPFLGM
jgi:hypothetical protein